MTADSTMAFEQTIAAAEKFPFVETRSSPVVRSAIVAHEPVGVVVAISHELGLPVRYVGVGESVADLRGRVALEDVARQAPTLGLTQAVGPPAVVILQGEHRARPVQVAEHSDRQVQLADRLLDVMAAHSIRKDAERLGG